MPHTSHSSLVVQKVTLSMPRKRTKNSKSYHKQPPKPSRSITQQQLQSAGTLQYITKAGSGVSQSSRGPSAVRSGRPKKAIRERVICEPQADPDLINGSTYFKVNIYIPSSIFIPGTEIVQIGDPVYVRRWFDQDKEYSVWLLGKVMRPVFCNDRQVRTIYQRRFFTGCIDFSTKGREERRYLVSYWDPRTKNEKEKIFSPSMKEITAVDMPTTTTTITAAVPVTGPSNCSMEASGYDNVKRHRLFR